jgi:YVTN family beta-propeller protein
MTAMKKNINAWLLLLLLSAVLLRAQTSTPTIATVAGGGPNNVPAVQAPLNSPGSVAMDSSGSMYIAAWQANRVFKVDPSGQLTVYAGNGFRGWTGDNGPAVDAELDWPMGVAVDGDGNLFIADCNNNVIREIKLVGGVPTIYTVAGSVGWGYSGDGAAATSAGLAGPTGVAVDGNGNIFVADQGNDAIRVFTVGGNITTVAGNGTPGYSGDGFPANKAQLNAPEGVAADGTGNIFIADSLNNVIRVVTPDGYIETVAGMYGTGGYNGDGIPATSASLSFPYAVAISGNNLLISDSQDELIRSVSYTPSPFAVGNITTIAGDGDQGWEGDGVLATVTSVFFPEGLSLDNSGNILAVDSENYRIRQFAIGGVIQTVAGNGWPYYGGDGGPAVNATLSGNANKPSVAVDGSGNLFISDSANNMIRRVDSITGVITAFAGSPQWGYSGDNDLALNANLDVPEGLAFDQNGNLYFADTFNNVIRRIDASTQVITTVAGNGASGYSGDNAGPGTAVNATLNYPSGLAIGSDGNLYVADTFNCVIRKVDLTQNSISTYAGNSFNGCPDGTNYGGDGVPANAAYLAQPQGLAFDSTGNLYIADSLNNLIRMVDTNGTINLFAGTFNDGCYESGDNGPATSAYLCDPLDVTVDGGGNVFIADGSGRIRKVASDATQTITTVAGNGLPDFSGDGGDATLAKLYNPTSLAGDANGNLFVYDSGNSRVRKITNVFSSQPIVTPPAAGTPVMSINPGYVSFDNTPFGTSPTQPLTFTNTGTGTLTITGWQVTGTNANDFTVAAGNCGPPVNLAPGASCTVSVTYSPLVVDSGDFATMVITDSAADSPQTVWFSGSMNPPTTGVGTIQAGLNPTALAINPITNKTYVANSGGSTVTVIDGATDQTTSITVGGHPAALGVNPYTNKIYVANQNDGTVSVIDGASQSVTATVVVGSSPQAVAVNSVTNKIYIANFSSASVSEIDGATNAVSATLTTGTNPVALAINTATNMIYVANQNGVPQGSSAAGNTVTAINGATHATGDGIVGAGPVAIAVNPVTNQVYVANETDGTVTVFAGDAIGTSLLNYLLTDVTANTIGVYTSPCALAVDPAGNQIYAANCNYVSLAVIDGATNNAQLIWSGGNPVAVAVNPANGQIFVANAGDNTVWTYNIQHGGRLQTVGNGLTAVAVNPVTGRVYATNSTDGTVSVFDTAQDYPIIEPIGAKVDNQAGPAYVAFNPDTDTVFTADYTDDAVVYLNPNLGVWTPIGSHPDMVAVNPATNRAYIANQTDGTVSVLNPVTFAVDTVKVASEVWLLAVNPATNKIYVAASDGTTFVAVIDGATNAVSAPILRIPNNGAIDSLTVNPADNKVYVGSNGYVTVIDGASNTYTSVDTNTLPNAMAVNPVTGKVYAVDTSSSTRSVQVFDANLSSRADVPIGNIPTAVAVNPFSNKVYVVSQNAPFKALTVIDGGSNTILTTVDVGSQPDAVSVNPVTNKIYVKDSGTNTFSVIDGITDTLTDVFAGDARWCAGAGVRYDPVIDMMHNEILFADCIDNSLTYLSDHLTQPVPLVATVTPFAGNQSADNAPTVTFTTSSTYSPVAPPAQAVYYQVDTWQGLWLSASGSAPTFSGQLPVLALGNHILYSFATDGNDAGGMAMAESVIGGISAYAFTVNGTTHAGKQQASVTLTNLNQTYTAAPLAAGATTIPANLNVSFTYNGSATPPTAVGTYTVVATVNDAGYYGTASGTLTISPAPLTITASSWTKVYGTTTTLLGIEFTTSGLLGGDSVSNATLTCAGTAATAIIGNYSIVPSAAQGSGLANYTIIYLNGTLVVGRAPLTIKASDLTKTYGTQVNFAGTEFTVTGLMNGDSVTSVTLTSAGAAAGAAVSGSPYTITPSGAQGVGLANYGLTYVNGSLTVNPAILTIAAKDQSKTYGQALTFTGMEFTATGLVNGDTASSVTLSSAGAQATAGVSGSPYAIVPSAVQGTGLANYTIGYVNGQLTVTPATLTITASSWSKVYGTVTSFLGIEFTTSGLVNGDSVSNVTLTCAGAAATATFGNYNIVPSNAVGTGLNNYTLNYVNGTLAVGRAPLTIKANDLLKAYGRQVTFAGTEFTVSGLLNGDTVTNVTLASAGAAATAPVSGSPYAIIPSAAQGSGIGNYGPTYVQGSLTVVPASATVMLSGVSQTFDGITPRAVTVTTNPAGLSYALTYNGSAAAPINAGQYSLVATITDPNYTGSATGTLYVAKADQTISFVAAPATAAYNTSFQVIADSTSALPVTVTASGACAVTSSESQPSVAWNGFAYIIATYATITMTSDSGACTMTATQSGDGNFNPATSVTQTTEPPAPIAVGASSSQTATLVVTKGGTLGSIQVVTQGNSNLYFNAAAGGTCAVGASYSVGQTCTVNVTFTPQYPGVSNGGVLLEDAAGNLLATAYVSGVAAGPEIMFNLEGISPFTLDTYQESVSTPFGGTGALVVDAAGSVHVAEWTVGCLACPNAITADAAGNVYVADQGGYVSKFPAGGGAPVTLAPAGLVETLPGVWQPNMAMGVAVDGAGDVFAVYADSSVVKIPAGGGTPVRISGQYATAVGIAADTAGNVYLSGSCYNAYDKENINCLLKIDPSGNQTTLAPDGAWAYSDVAADSTGNVYVIDRDSSDPSHTEHLVKIPAGGGTPQDITGRLPASVTNLYGVAVDASGNAYVGDHTGKGIWELPAGGGPAVMVDGNADVNQPYSLGVDAKGNIYVVDSFFMLTTITPAGTSTSLSLSVDGPSGVALDGAGILYVADPMANRVVKKAANNAPTTVGTGLNHPYKVAVDSLGNLYVAEYSGWLWKISPSGAQTQLAPVAEGDGLAVDSAENVYVADGSLGKIWKLNSGGGSPVTVVTAATDANDKINGLAVDASGSVYYSNSYGVTRVPADGSPAQSLNVTGSPISLAVDPAGEVYVAEGTLPWTVERFDFGKLDNGAGISWPVITYGQMGAVETATMINIGNQPLTFSGINFGPDFILADGNTNCLTPVAAGDSCTVNLQFTPLQAGSVSESLVLTDNAPYEGGQQSLGLAANMLPAKFSQILVSTKALAFNPEYVGMSTPVQSVTLKNVASTPVTVSGAALTGANPGDFALNDQTGTCIAGMTLQYLQYCAMSVTFNPTVVGARSASLVIGSTAFSGGTYTIPLTGAGEAGLPYLTLSAEALNFATPELVGTPSGAQYLTISSLGTAPLHVSNVTVIGANPGDFSVSDQAGTCTTGATLNYNAKCNLRVVFTPTAAGPRSATLSITDDYITTLYSVLSIAHATASPQLIPLTGTGQAPVPVIALSATSLNFATPELVGTPSGAQYLTIASMGTGALQVSGVTISGANPGDFSVSDQAGTCTTGATLAYNGKCNLRVVFAPTEAGARSATLLIADNVSVPPQQVTLTGTGQAPAPEITLSAPSLNFATPQLVGTPAGAQYLTIASMGTAPLVVTGVTVGGANPGDFAVSNQANTCTTGATLAYNVKCNLRVIFFPGARGARSAILFITDNVSGSPQQVTLTGTGQGPAPLLTLSTNELDFGSKPVGGSTVAQYVLITSAGSAPLYVSGVAVTGSASGDFQVSDQAGTCSTSGATLAYNAKCNLRVVFHPQAAGDRTATLVITDNTDNSPHTVLLTGTGACKGTACF